MNWDILVLLGSSLCMAQALVETRAIDWLSGNVFAGAGSLGPLGLGLLVIFATIVFRLGFPNNFSVVAALLPLVFSLAKNNGLNPVWLGLLTLGASVLGLLFPTQAMTHLTVYSAGYISMPDMVRIGLAVTLALVGVMVGMAFFYWPMLGIAVLR